MVDRPRVQRTETAALGVLLLLAAGLRLALWGTQSIVSVDGVAYIRMAQALGGGASIDTVHQYGYPALILLAHLLVPDWVTAARVVDLAGGLVVVFLVWTVARTCIDTPWLRLLPAAAMAFLPLPVLYSLTTMSDMPYLIFCLLSVGFALRGRWFASGLAGGAAYVIRPEILLVLAVLALVRIRRPRQAGAVILGAVLFVVPYVMATGFLEGNWALSRKGIDIAAGTWRESEVRAGEAVSTDAMERLSVYGTETLRAWPRRATAVAWQVLRQAGWAAPILAWLPWRAPLLPLFAGLAPLFTLTLSFLGERARYTLPFIPFLWILACVQAGRIRGIRWRSAVIALLLAGGALTAFRERSLYTEQVDGYFPELVAAGRWLASLARPETTVFDRKPYTAFYAGARFRSLPTGSYDEVIGDVIAQGGDYLVVNNWVASHFRPELLPLVSDPARITREERLAPVYVAGSRRGFLTVIYRVVRPGGPPPQPGEADIRASLVKFVGEPGP